LSLLSDVDSGFLQPPLATTLIQNPAIDWLNRKRARRRPAKKNCSSARPFSLTDSRLQTLGAALPVFAGAS
jgi:hypothetical protein